MQITSCEVLRDFTGYITTISTSRCEVVLENLLFSKIILNCWYETEKRRGKKDNTFLLVATFKIIIPTGWTPKILLGAISLTLKEDNYSVVEKMNNLDGYG